MTGAEDASGEGTGFGLEVTRCCGKEEEEDMQAVNNFGMSQVGLTNIGPYLI